MPLLGQQRTGEGDRRRRGVVFGGTVVVVVVGVTSKSASRRAVTGMIGFVTDDEQPAAVVHGPVVMVVERS